MPRKCSACGAVGHNSRTCPHRLPEGGGRGMMRKSASLPSLQGLHTSASTLSLQGLADAALDDELFEDDDEEGGAAEAEQVQPGDSPPAPPAAGGDDAGRERKKGVPWTEEEHRFFLLGLQRLGKGDWRGISRQFVLSRTPTQVASHAQKYFIRQNNLNKRKRRSSLFDIVAAPPLPLPLPRDGRPLGASGGAAWASPALAAHLAAQLAAAQASALRTDGAAAPPPSAAGAASLFGGLPSGMNASALLAAAVGAGGASIAPPSLSQQPADAAALLPLLYHQWLVSGGAAGGTGAPGAPGGAPYPLAGAAFHRSALVPSSTLFRPVPVRATANATWRMVKSASMPELRELRLEDFAADDSPRLMMPRPTAAAAGGSLGSGSHADGGAGSEASGRGRDGAMSPIAEGDSAGGATPSTAEAAVGA